MTVNANYTPPVYTGNGTTKAFAFAYPFFTATELIVNLFDTTANANVNPQPSLNGAGTYDFTVTGAIDPDTAEYLAGATVVFNNAPLGNHQITISRNVAARQPVSLSNNAKFPAKTIEAEFDRVTMVLQQVLAGTPLTGPNTKLWFAGSVAAARALVSLNQGLTSGQLLVVHGHLAAGDGGDRVMRWDDTSNAADNSATILKPGDRLITDLGRWLIINPNEEQQPQIFGAVAGVADQGPALQAWLDYHAGRRRARIRVGASFTSNQALSATISEIDFNYSDITFAIPAVDPHTADLFTFNGNGSYTPGSIVRPKNLIMYCAMCGRDGIKFTHGTPRPENIHIQDAYRDAIMVFSSLTGAHYIEKACFDSVYGYFLGRHFCTLWVQGNTYINRTTFRKCEVRGLGRRFAGAHAFNLLFDNVTNSGATIHGLVIRDSNFDCQMAQSLGIGDFLYVDQINGSTQTVAGDIVFEDLDVETTTGAEVGAYLVNWNSGAGVTQPGVERIARISRFLWGTNPYPAALNDNVSSDLEAFGGVSHPQLMKAPAPRSNGIAVPISEFGGRVDENFLNIPAPFRKTAVLAANSVVNVDVPITALNPGNFGAGAGPDWSQWPFDIIIAKKAFSNSRSFDMGGRWICTVSRTSATGVCYVAPELIGVWGDPANYSYGFDPTVDIGFSIVSSGGTLQDILRITFTLNAPNRVNIGFGGSSPNVRISVMRLGGGIQNLGDITAIVP